ncbi:hypothetical protein RHMOL_Rhmol11G0276900 [Rhododendron molle]|uniref:Uncharacterized protein n=1 Tax=Rhododendron molle TaxID=49168 RepID=A0ACC0LXT4_RHOML|nr:hypothetical protein RHMOL_Rhmol11G0276900 [Rhododendron molle]
MTNHQDDLDLLLSLQDRVLETPPASPSTLHCKSPGYLSDDGSPKRVGQASMSVFRTAVQDCLDYEPESTKKSIKSNQIKKSNDPEVEKFSGLRIRNRLLSQLELSNRFSDIRFLRLPAIKNVLVGDTLSGCWATVGVVTGRGNTKMSSTGKSFCVLQVGCLDEKTISVFLFGDAYQKYSKEEAGAVLALFSCGVRKDKVVSTFILLANLAFLKNARLLSLVHRFPQGPGFSLSVYSAGQILKIGTSSDFGVCKAKKNDGMACTLVINKLRGVYCSYHIMRASEKYSVTRTELKGGNLRFAIRDPRKSDGIYLVDPLADRTNLRKSRQPAKLLSVEGLKKALRSSSAARLDTPVVRSQQTNAKRTKMEQERATSEKTKQVGEKMIELEFISSDEEM